jgi:signal transduction histidine kinase
MKYRFDELVDVDQIQSLMRAFYEMTGVPSTITGLDGVIYRTSSGVIVGAGWKRICLDFHRVHPEAERNCIESDSCLALYAQQNGGGHYKCTNGLVDVAIPLTIDGEHLANLFTGQFLLEPPDINYFRAQAVRYGFDVDAYLDALKEVPVFDVAFVRRGLAFLEMLAVLIGEMGLVQKRLREQLELSRRAQEEAERLRRDAERASEVRSHFFASASHDLRQPVQAVRLFLDVLGRRLAASEHAFAVEQASLGLASAEGILESLFDVARIESGVVAPEPQVVSLAEVFDALQREFAPQAVAKGLVLRVAPTGREVVTDRLMLERILRNLVGNAIRYTKVGKVLIGARRWGDGVRIEVGDTGPGIAPEDLHRIWDEFYQVGNVSRDRREGLGLGLSIAQKLARTLEHQLWVRSTVGRGTMFSLILGLGRLTVGQEPSYSPP